jgi:methylated-DNA-[protein]-cysteine S-methyltransferase
MIIYTHRFSTPVGDMLAAVDEAGALVRLQFGSEGDTLDMPNATVVTDRERCDHVVKQLGEYFRQERREFDLPLAMQGTPFQKTVWTALLTIPYGVTISYRELAERIGSPAAVRAVGRANGSNPIPIVVPCHRVIGADGSLTGYGGGIAAKEQLLRLEGAAHVQYRLSL